MFAAKIKSLYEIRDSKILDFGSGVDSEIAIELSESAAYVLCVDKSKSVVSRISNAISNNQFANINAMDLESFKNINTEFDLAVASLVLHHVHNHELASMLKLIYNRLKLGGCLLVIDFENCVCKRGSSLGEIIHGLKSTGFRIELSKRWKRVKTENGSTNLVILRAVK